MGDHPSALGPPTGLGRHVLTVDHQQDPSMTSYSVLIICTNLNGGGNHFLASKFLPPPRIIWTLLNFWKKLIFDGKKGPSFKHIFDIIAPPLTLAKKVPKPYQNGDYFIHIKAIVYLPIVAYISPISVANIVKIKVIFQLHELRKNLKICTPPPLIQNGLHFELETIFILGVSIYHPFKFKT